MANLIIYNYLNFIKEKGRPVSEIIPGSEKYALSVNDALYAVDLLTGSQSAVLGGDILSDKFGKLIYAYQYWGDGYHYLNWYCDPTIEESQADYAERSYHKAKESINEASEIAKKLGENCYIVLVI